MTVLLTGATGLIGANLARRLAHEGSRPRLLVRLQSNRRALAGFGFEESLGDILDLNSLRKAMGGVSEVYHLAASIRQDPASASGTRRVHVDGTRNVMQAARAAGVRRVLYVSGTAAIGPGTMSEPSTEATPYRPDAANAYQETKREAEELALAGSGADFEVVVANPSYTVGAYDARPSSGRILLFVARNLVKLYPTGGTNYVAAADVAKGLALVMAKGRAGERYILGGENLTHLQFLTLCAEEAGVAPPSLPLPEGLASRLAKLGDRVGGVAPGFLRSINSATLAALYRPAYYSSQKAARELGYQPGPVRAGVREGYRWFQEEGFLPRGHTLAPRHAA